MDLHQMLLIHDILHCKVMSKMKDVDQNFVLYTGIYYKHI